MIDFKVEQVNFVHSPSINFNLKNSPIEKLPIDVHVPSAMSVLIETVYPVRLYSTDPEVEFLDETTQESIKRQEQEMFENLRPQSQQILERNIDKDKKYTFRISFMFRLYENNWERAVYTAQKAGDLIVINDSFSLFPTKYEEQVELFNDGEYDTLNAKEIFEKKQFARQNFVGGGLLGSLRELLLLDSRVGRPYITI